MSVVIIPMSNSVNELALRASTDERAREDIIRAHETLILRTASKVSRRFVTKSDDEWSVALGAFSDAIDRYDASRGDFLPFSQMLIRRALVDYFRAEARHLTEVSTSPFVLEGSEDAEETDEQEKTVYLAVVQQSADAADRSLEEEVRAANELLQDYGFRFFDLTECSPQQEKTRMECAAAIRWMLADRDRVRELEKTRKLPVRLLAAESGVSRKTLDRYRRYIIMAVLILDGDYPQIAEYLKFVWKGENR